MQESRTAQSLRHLCPRLPWSVLPSVSTLSPAVLASIEMFRRGRGESRLPLLAQSMEDGGACQSGASDGAGRRRKAIQGVKGELGN